ncbi:MAG: cell division protein FtsA [Chitinophagales bacterium]|nr:cell division protein FtsA [Chitinophagales bacterium]
METNNNVKSKFNDVVCAIDIGTSKVAALVARRNQYNKVEILGIGICPSFGVQRGVVINITKTVESIKKAVAEAEKVSGISFEKVHVGIAGKHIKSMQNRSQINRTNVDSWITHEDVKRLKEESYKIALPPGDRIIHVLQQEYIIDNEPNISDPVGMMGVKMEGNFHIITGAEAAIQNIEMCIKAAGLEVASIELEPLASSDAVLNAQELEAGVALVDIGGGTTDVAIFENNTIRHTAVIPFGGNIITEDLRDFRILKEQAEVLKVKYGYAIPFEALRNQHVSIQGVRSGNNKELNLLSVAKVISARMKEILAHVDYQIKLSGYGKKLISGIVLTGGGSQLKNLVQLTEMETGQIARVGLPKEHLAHTRLKEIENPMYATGIGLVIRAFKLQDEESLCDVPATTNNTTTEVKTETPKTEIVNPIVEEDINKKEEDFSIPEEKIIEPQVNKNTDKKKSLVSIWGKRIGDWLKDDNDFTDI